MPGSCSYAGGNPSKNFCCEFRGIFEREKLVANISEVVEYEIQISQQRVLVPRLLCVDTVGKNTTKIKEYIANQIKENKMMEQMTITELLDPFKQ